jgi:hypothetical protein
MRLSRQAVCEEEFFSEALLTCFIVWHNIAYGIDFSGGSVEYYHSTGSDPLALMIATVSVSASSVRMKIPQLVSTDIRIEWRGLASRSAETAPNRIYRQRTRGLVFQWSLCRERAHDNIHCWAIVIDDEPGLQYPRLKSNIMWTPHSKPHYYPLNIQPATPSH